MEKLLQLKLCTLPSETISKPNCTWSRVQLLLKEPWLTMSQFRIALMSTVAELVLVVRRSEITPGSPARPKYAFQACPPIVTLGITGAGVDEIGRTLPCV